MKNLIFLFFIFLMFLFSISSIKAVGFSPSSLVYEIEQGKKECLNVSIVSDSEKIIVTDKWAENESVAWEESLFDKTASDHNLIIRYDNELLPEERELEVCLSGKNIGEYHGVIVLEEQQVGNTIIQIGVWTKVNITKPKPAQPQSSNQGSGGGGGGIVYSNGAVKTKDENKTEVSLTEKSEEKDEELPVAKTEIPEENKNTGVPITGAAVADESFNYNPILLAAIIFTAAITFAVILVYKKRRML